MQLTAAVWVSMCILPLNGLIPEINSDGKPPHGCTFIIF